MEDRIAEFRNIVYEHYRVAGRRDLPWRPPMVKIRANGSVNPYRVLVSEVMLQQTQAGRVISKYKEFLRRFPTLSSLAVATPKEVLAAWQGLGYNRRALALHRAAAYIQKQYGGRVPRTQNELVALPGIGSYTAGAIVAFAYNEPAAFIETNIRRAHLDFFFPGEEGVKDTDIISVVQQTLDARNPREWYYALMDYGAALGRTSVNANRRSAHYTKQSAFEGSDRQLRARIVRALLAKSCTHASLTQEMQQPEERVARIVASLVKDGMVARRGRVLCIIEK